MREAVELGAQHGGGVAITTSTGGQTALSEEQAEAGG